MNREEAIEAIRALIRASFCDQGVSKEESISFLESLAGDIGLDRESLFALAQSLLAKAFEAVAGEEEVYSKRSIGEIDSDVIPEGNISPQDSRRAHVPFAPRVENAGEPEIGVQYLRRARRLVPGIREVEGLLGGYVCLADLSRRKSEQTGTSAIYSPAALGLAYTTESSSLYELVRHGRLRLERVEGHGYNTPDAIQMHVFNPRDRVLVRIQRGTVFERQSDDDIQSLSVKEDVAIWVNPGSQAIRAFGMCMDQEASPPSGQRLSLTPWVLRPRLNDQDDLWAFTERRARDEGEEPDDQEWDEGEYEFELLGERKTAGSQKDAFEAIIRGLAVAYEDFLEDVASRYEEEKAGQVPLIARRRSHLPRWAQSSAVEISDGYWLHTAMSAKVKLRKIMEACEVADVEFGDPEGVIIDL
ncbi:MAG: hypothetical protein OXQ90_05075 [Gammaproteobacteria bacterium]|nr:hypothetical protein [Gammaproteobacteria bacterium]